MWGFHDDFLILRTALHRLLTSGLEKEGLKRRWRYQTQLRNNDAGGLTFSEEEWKFEWEEILQIATNQCRQQPTTDSLRRYSSLRPRFESLEEIHIFVLAHTLRRPVIVISDRTVKDHQGQDLAPIYFGGIYLPLEVNPTSCYKSPMVLAYDSSHFSPLVAKHDEFEAGLTKQQKSSKRKETVIPLVTPDGALLPVQFIYDPTKNDVQEKWSNMKYEVGEFPDDIVQFLEKYLNIRWIQLKVPAVGNLEGCNDDDNLFPIRVPKVRFPAANITQEAQPTYQRELVEKYLDHIKSQYHEEKMKKASWQAEREKEDKMRLQNMTVSCEGVGCNMFGRPATRNLCSICYQKMLIESQDEREYAKGEEDVTIGSDVVGKYEGDSVNVHNKVVVSVPPTFPNAHIQRLPDHVSPVNQSGSSGTSGSPSSGSVVGGDMGSTSPGHGTGVIVELAASPTRALNRSRDTQRDSSGGIVVKPATKVRSLSPSQGVMERHQSSSSSTYSSPLTARGTSVPTPPSSRSPSPSPKGKGSSGSIEKRSLPPSSQVIQSKKATTSAKLSGGGQYTRDNIQPLHFDHTQQTSTGASSGIGNAKETCKSSNCEFFGSAKNGGYCSSCFKKQKQKATRTETLV